MSSTSYPFLEHQLIDTPSLATTSSIVTSTKQQVRWLPRRAFAVSGARQQCSSLDRCTSDWVISGRAACWASLLSHVAPFHMSSTSKERGSGNIPSLPLQMRMRRWVLRKAEQCLAELRQEKRIQSCRRQTGTQSILGRTGALLLH